MLNETLAFDDEKMVVVDLNSPLYAAEIVAADDYDDVVVVVVVVSIANAIRVFSHAPNHESKR